MELYYQISVGTLKKIFKMYYSTKLKTLVRFFMYIFSICVCNFSLHLELELPGSGC